VLCDSIEAAAANVGLAIEAVPEQLELKKEIFKTLKGKYVTPAPIEGAFARIERPSGSATLTCAAPSTTWLLVRIRPSGVKTTPDPPPRPASIFTTAGPTMSTARMTACEYASRSSLSSGWEISGITV